MVGGDVLPIVADGAAVGVGYDLWGGDGYCTHIVVAGVADAKVGGVCAAEDVGPGGGIVLGAEEIVGGASFHDAWALGVPGAGAVARVLVDEHPAGPVEQVGGGAQVDAGLGAVVVVVAGVVEVPGAVDVEQAGIAGLAGGGWI